MTQEKEWWEDKKYYEEIDLERADDKGCEIWDIQAIVAEATRRGELKAWEEAKKSIESSHMNVCGNPLLAADVNASVKLFKRALVRRIDVKCASLTNGMI